MTKEEQQFWANERDTGDKMMKERYKTWKRLIGNYRLQFSIPGMKKKKLVRLSRMYPLVRQILASTVLKNPKALISARPLVENYIGDIGEAADKLEQAGNETIRITRARLEFLQAVFDLQFCGLGWLKQGVNPAGDDAIPPYVANDVFAEDFTYIMRLPPFRVWVDGLCSPTRLGYARYVRERIYAPLEFIMRDERYNKEKENIKVPEAESDDDLMTEVPLSGADKDEEHLRNMRANGKLIALDEWHDRLHYKRITFAEGVESPIEEVDHPFRKMEPTYEQDPIDGRRILSNLTPSTGYILDQGFQYIDLRMDRDLHGFYPVAPMEYIEDLEGIILKAVSRRNDLQERFKRIVFGDEEIKNRNPNLSKELQQAEDGDVLWVGNKDGLREANWGSVPADALNLEADMRGYEEQTLHVNTMNAGGSRKSATEVANRAGQGELTREWNEDVVVDGFTRFLDNSFRIFRDPRYTPKRFMVQVGRGSEELTEAILTPEDFDYRWSIDIDVASMRPGGEIVARDNALLLYDRLMANGNADPLELDKMLVRSVLQHDNDKLFRGRGRVEAQRAAQLENEGWIMNGQDPGVEEGQDHRAHLEVHRMIEENETFLALPPEQQEMIMEVLEQHSQAHFDMMTQAGSPGGGLQQPQVNGQIIQSGNSMIDQVRSDAQDIANAAQVEAEALRSQG